jgi:5-methyltetrahydropteroyltriglutamate--homocysteine methyltransferase
MQMHVSADRIMTTHTGSLHRPADLEEMFRRKLADEDTFDEKAFEARLRTAVAEIVRKQADIGIDLIDDGEYSKVDFFSYAKYRLEGIDARLVKRDVNEKVSTNKFLHPAMKSVMSSLAVRQRFAQFYADTEPPEGAVWPSSVIQMYIPVGTAVEKPAIYAVTGALRYKPGEVTRDIENLKAALKGVSVKGVFMPVVAPGMFATRHINEYYKSEEEYYFAVADALNVEYQAIIDAGFDLQIDDVSLPGRYRIQVPAEGIDAFQRWCGLAVDALNRALRGIPEDRVRYHLCWSSQNAPHTDDAPLGCLIEPILKIKAQGYQLEAANVRHGHEWTVWAEAKIPDSKILMPGVISHATNVIEHPDYIAQLILKYTDIVGRERVVAATDCGFRWRVHPEIAWAKLEALVDGARVATRKLWAPATSAAR